MIWQYQYSNSDRQFDKQMLYHVTTHRLIVRFYRIDLKRIKSFLVIVVE